MKQKEQWSETFGENVTITKETYNVPYLECSRCGKPLRTVYVVQGCETGIEHMYLGKECINHLS